MATLHVATLSPSKLDLLTDWLTTDAHVGGLAAGGLAIAGAFRFDDPAGVVGIECHLLRTSDGTVLHLPVTYRGEPMPSLAAHLVGQMEHSVLGTRWVYDGCADPVYVNELVRTMLTGGRHVELVVQTDDGPVIREPNAQVAGTGSEQTSPTVDSIAMVPHETGCTVRSGSVAIEVRRIVDAAATSASGVALLGTWMENPTPTVLAELV